MLITASNAFAALAPLRPCAAWLCSKSKHEAAPYERRARSLQVLKKVGPDAVVDMDSALCRESLDVIGARFPPDPAPPTGMMHP